MKLLRSVMAISLIAMSYGCGGPHVTGSDPSAAGSSSSDQSVQDASQADAERAGDEADDEAQPNH